MRAWVLEDPRAVHYTSGTKGRRLTCTSINRFTGPAPRYSATSAQAGVQGFEPCRAALETALVLVRSTLPAWPPALGREPDVTTTPATGRSSRLRLWNFDQLSISDVVESVQRVPGGPDARFSRKPACSGVRSAFRLLHATQASTQFSHRDGLPWHEARRGRPRFLASPASAAVLAVVKWSCLNRFRRLNVTAAVGNRSYSVSVIASGIACRNRTASAKASPSFGAKSHPVLPGVGLKSTGSTTRADSFHNSTRARATVATWIGCQLRFNTSVGLECSCGHDPPPGFQGLADRARTGT